MHAFAFARRTTKHSGITRVQARDVKSCDTLCRHGQEHDVTVADRTFFSFLKMRILFKREYRCVFSELKKGPEKKKEIGQKIKGKILFRFLIYLTVKSKLKIKSKQPE